MHESPVYKSNSSELVCVSDMLERITDKFVTNLEPNTNEDADKDYLKVITKPFTNLIIQV